MTAALHHQRFGNQRHGKLSADTQPTVVVFAYGKRFIEAANPLEQLLGHHHRRWTHQAKRPAWQENIARRLPMNRSRIDSDAVANPDLLRLADLIFRMLRHECSLSLELARQPGVVGVEKRDIATTRL